MVHLEFTNKDFAELDAFGEFPHDKVLGVGVVDAKNTMVESVEQIADRIRRALRWSRPTACSSPDCGLGYFSRTTAYAKLRSHG